MRFDLNLAPYKYDYLIRKEKIIQNIQIHEVEILPGHRGFEAQTYLNVDFNQSKPKYELHSNADGVGSDKIQKIAIYKSISEALERWAYSDFKSRGLVEESAGFAAFPGLTNLKAKSFSLYEAVERWALHMFNRGQLPLEFLIKKDGIEYYFSKINRPSVYFIICSSLFDNYYTYGFGASHSIEQALEAAQKEIIRNKRSMNLYYKNRVPTGILQENRIIYFSQNDGHLHFLQLIEKSKEVKVNFQNLILDVQYKVNGPWSKFAQVWFTKFKNDYEVDMKSMNYFYF